jgi:hypothetical protein
MCFKLNHWFCILHAEYFIGRGVVPRLAEDADIPFMTPGKKNLSGEKKLKIFSAGIKFFLKQSFWKMKFVVRFRSLSEQIICFAKRLSNLAISQGSAFQAKKVAEKKRDRAAAVRLSAATSLNRPVVPTAGRLSGQLYY